MLFCVHTVWSVYNVFTVYTVYTVFTAFGLGWASEQNVGRTDWWMIPLRLLWLFSPAVLININHITLDIFMDGHPQAISSISCTVCVSHVINVKNDLVNRKWYQPDIGPKHIGCIRLHFQQKRWWSSKIWKRLYVWNTAIVYNKYCM